MQSTQIDHIVVLVSEIAYSKLPTAVRKLIAANATPIPSGDSGVYSFEARLCEWEEIKLELLGSNPASRGQETRFALIDHYVNDYQCLADRAQWSRCNCESVEPDCCPVCERSVEPLTSERYVVILHVPESGSGCMPHAEPVSSSSRPAVRGPTLNS
jgi:hypothetical protein